MIDRDQYAAMLLTHGLSDNTIRVYTAMCQRWCDWAITNHVNPARPDPQSIRAWSKTVTRTRPSQAHARAAIRWWCLACNTDDVSTAIRLPKKPSTAKPLLDRDQTVALLQAAHSAGIAGVAVIVSLYTAGRRSEVAELAWPNVNFAQRQVTLTRPKQSDLITLPLHPHLAGVLSRRFDPDGMWVFPGRWGGHVSPAQIWRWVVQVGEQAGLGRVTPHMLRRTSLTEINERTGDLRAAQLFAGHSSPVTTAGYTRVSDRRLKAASDALDWAA